MDEIGLANLGTSAVAERLGTRAPSLYEHVNGLTDLTHRVAVFARNELADKLRDALQGRARREALAAAAHAVRSYVNEHPGRYAATTAAQPIAGDDTLRDARERTLASFAAVLHGYRAAPAEEIHALRMLRSVLHGFATLQTANGFQLAADVDDSFNWLIDFIDRGLLAAEDLQALARD